MLTTPIEFNDSQAQLFRRDIPDLIRSVPSDFSEVNAWLTTFAQDLREQRRSSLDIRLRQVRDRRAQCRRSMFRDKHIPQLHPSAIHELQESADRVCFNSNPDSLCKGARTRFAAPQDQCPKCGSHEIKIDLSREVVLAERRRVHAMQIRQARRDAGCQSSNHEIIGAAAGHLLGTVLSTLTPDEAFRTARRALFVAWVLTETGNIRTDPMISPLQNWDWTAPPAEVADRPLSRLVTRLTFFDPNFAQWQALYQWAISVAVQDRMSSQPQWTTADEHETELSPESFAAISTLHVKSVQRLRRQGVRLTESEAWKKHAAQARGQDVDEKMSASAETRVPESRGAAPPEIWKCTKPHCNWVGELKRSEEGCKACGAGVELVKIRSAPGAQGLRQRRGS